MWPSNKGKQKKQNKKKATLNTFFAYVIQVKYVYKAAVEVLKSETETEKIPSPNIRNSLLTSVKFQLRFAALCGS